MPKTFKFDNGAVNLGTAVSGAVGAISAGPASVGAGTVVFSNSNGVSFGVNGSTVTASVAAGGGGGVAISAGAQSVSTGTMVFSNSNGVTFGMSGSSRITASHNGLTAGIQSLSAGTTRATAGEVVLSNSNGLSFGINGGTVTGSYTVPTQTPFGISAGAQSVSTGTLVFSNSNNVTFGMSGSSRITASASFPAETPFGLSAGSQSVSTGTMIFANSNGLTFGMSGSSQITASHNGITSQSNQQITAYATGNTTQSSSGTYNASSLVFRGDGVASVGVSNGSVVVSVPAGGGGLTNINVSGGTTSNNLQSVIGPDHSSWPSISISPPASMPISIPSRMSHRPWPTRGPGLCSPRSGPSTDVIVSLTAHGSWLAPGSAEPVSRRWSPVSTKSSPMPPPGASVYRAVCRTSSVSPRWRTSIPSVPQAVLSSSAVRIE